MKQDEEDIARQVFALLRKHARPVYAYLRGKGVKPTDFDDLSQIVALKLHRRGADNLPPIQKERAWLKVVYAHAWRDMNRRRRPVLADDRFWYTQSNTLADTTPPPDHAARTEAAQIINAAIAALPDALFEIIKLRCLGCSLREISEIQRASIQQVKGDYRKAKRLLRRKLMARGIDL